MLNLKKLVYDEGKSGSRREGDLNLHNGGPAQEAGDILHKPCIWGPPSPA